MRFRNVGLAVLAVACTAALALSTVWEWTGLGPDDDWDTCRNWAIISGSSNLCYPSLVSDDATIPYANVAWDIDLTPVYITMGDLTIEGSVDFCTGLNQATLDLTSLTIDASDGEVEITNACSSQITVD